MNNRPPIVNANAVLELQRIDPVFAAIEQQYGLPNNWQRPEGFESLCQIILEQQVSLNSAKAAYDKVKQRIGAFTPSNMLKLTTQDLRECYVSRQKASYFYAVANATIDRTLDFEALAVMETEEAKANLKQVKGIGNWTAEIYLIFCFQAKDIFAAGDIALINAIKDLYGVTTKEECIDIAAKWSPYRTLASFFLWHQYLSKRGRVVPS